MREPKIILAVLLLVALAGCGPGYQQIKCYQAVSEEFPGGQVWELPDSNYRFIVRDREGALWYVRTMNRGPEVSDRVLLFPAANRSESIR